MPLRMRVHDREPIGAALRRFKKLFERSGLLKRAAKAEVLREAVRTPPPGQVAQAQRHPQGADAGEAADAMKEGRRG